jgi:hypothetical protein
MLQLLPAQAPALVPDSLPSAATNESQAPNCAAWIRSVRGWEEDGSLEYLVLPAQDPGGDTTPASELVASGQAPVYTGGGWLAGGLGGMAMTGLRALRGGAGAGAGAERLSASEEQQVEHAG